MKYEDVKFYDEDTKALTLVTKITDMEKREVEVKKYHYPFHVDGIYTKKAIDLGAEVESNEYIISSDLFERLANFFTELYGKQFKQEELVKGIHQGVIIDTFLTMLFGVLQGDSKNE